MKRNIFFAKYLAVAMFALAGLSSCENNGAEDSTITASQEVAAKDQADADVAVEEAFDYSEIGATIAVEGGRVAGKRHPRLPECATVAINKEARTSVIDFGTGCLCPDGKTRSGKINVAFSKSGTEITMERARTITFDGYAVNGKAVTGTITTSEKINKTASTKECNIKAENLVVTFQDGATHVTTLANHTRTWKLADGTLTDTGSATGTNRNGNAYTLSIVTDIVRTKSCFESGVPFPISGVKQLEVTGKPTVKIDFGTGTCDNLATVQVGESTKEITLGKR